MRAIRGASPRKAKGGSLLVVAGSISPVPYPSPTNCRWHTRVKGITPRQQNGQMGTVFDRTSLNCRFIADRSWCGSARIAVIVMEDRIGEYMMGPMSAVAATDHGMRGGTRGGMIGGIEMLIDLMIDVYSLAQLSTYTSNAGLNLAMGSFPLPYPCPLSRSHMHLQVCLCRRGRSCLAVVRK